MSEGGPGSPPEPGFTAASEAGLPSPTGGINQALNTNTPPLAPGEQIDVADDGDDLDDGDSAVGLDSNASSTTSIAASLLNYRVLHGRTYHAPYGDADYWAPNDRCQNEGLERLHNALTMVLDDKLCLAPFDPSPKRVLDVGTGTGCWAINFADAYPDSEVIGTDVSPIQPSWVPFNVSFQMDDCLQDWTWPEDHFGLVHIRALYGSVLDWRALYRRAFRHLKPGGWLHDLEMDVLVQSDHVDIPPDHIFHRWADRYYDAGDRTGRTFRISNNHMMKEAMEAVGFVDVTEVKIKLPIGTWPRDSKLREVGALSLQAMNPSLEGYALYLFTSVLDWSRVQVFVFTAEFRQELRKRSNCPWIMTTVVYGRKPEAPPSQGII